MKVLIAGSGGREHCLAWKVAQSPLVDKVYCAPGNAGTGSIAENISLKASDKEGLLKFALDEKIDLTIIGPEAPLVDGAVDLFQSAGLKVFGPKKNLAMLEGSKVFAKDLMKKYGVPTADYKVFEDELSARDYIKAKGTPLVIKADGLAAGKGVLICKTQNEALEAIQEIMVDKKFGSAGDKVLIEEFIEGEEVSVLVFTDGETILPLVSSQDHKRILENDQGPNTGGMGAYSPAPIIGESNFKAIIDQVFSPLLNGLKKEGKVYKGMLYGGLMIRDDVPYVLEFNVRFGDPETQAILPKLKSDLVDVMLKTIDSKLDQVKLEWDKNFCICVVLASGGYPGSFELGKVVKGLDTLHQGKDIFIFHAGTKLVHSPQSIVHSNGKEASTIVTSGGRVLNVVALGSDIKDAQDKVYKAIDNIEFENMVYRRDIANKAL